MTGRIGARNRHGEYEITFMMDAEDCDNLAGCLPPNDGFAWELYDLADELRGREAARNDGPRVRVGIARDVRIAFAVTPGGGSSGGVA